ncbi:MAG: hypothetical protein AB7K37_15635 [Cyclobacteriaceae bacterium]
MIDKKDNTREADVDQKPLNIKADWDNLSGRIKHTFPGIDEEDLQFMANGEDEFIGRLQQKTGKTRHEIRRWARSMSKII